MYFMPKMFYFNDTICQEASSLVSSKILVLEKWKPWVWKRQFWYNICSLQSSTVIKYQLSSPEDLELKGSQPNNSLQNRILYLIQIPSLMMTIYTLLGLLNKSEKVIVKVKFAEIYCFVCPFVIHTAFELALTLP